MVYESFVEKLTDILVRQGSLLAKDAPSLKKAFIDSSGDYFDDFLLEEGFIEEADLLRALSTYYKVPAIDVTGEFVDTFLLHKFPKDFLLRHAILPLDVDENMLVVAASIPEKEGLESAIRQYVSYDVIYMVGLRREITDAVKEFYDKSLTDIDEDQEAI